MKIIAVVVALAGIAAGMVLKGGAEVITNMRRAAYVTD